MFFLTNKNYLYLKNPKVYNKDIKKTCKCIIYHIQQEM